MKMRDAEDSECRQKLKSTSREIQFEKGCLLQYLPGVHKVISNPSCRKLAEGHQKSKKPMLIQIFDAQFR